MIHATLIITAHLASQPALEGFDGLGLLVGAAIVVGGALVLTLCALLTNDRGRIKRR